VDGSCFLWKFIWILSCCLQKKEKEEEEKKEENCLKFWLNITQNAHFSTPTMIAGWKSEWNLSHLLRIMYSTISFTQHSFSSFYLPLQCLKPLAHTQKITKRIFHTLLSLKHFHYFLSLRSIVFPWRKKNKERKKKCQKIIGCEVKELTY
jgi:hypothetical protein